MGYAPLRRGADIGMALWAIGAGQAIEHPADHAANLAELGLGEAAGGAGGAAQAHAGGDHGLFRVEGDGVFVAGEVGAAECGLGGLAGDALGAKIDQHQMAVGAAGDDG